MEVTFESVISHLSMGAWVERDSSTVLVSMMKTCEIILLIIPLNDQFLYIYNLNLRNDSNDFHEILCKGGYGGNKSI